MVAGARDKQAWPQPALWLFTCCHMLIGTHTRCKILETAPLLPEMAKLVTVSSICLLLPELLAGLYSTHAECMQLVECRVFFKVSRCYQHDRSLTWQQMQMLALTPGSRTILGMMC